MTNPAAALLLTGPFDWRRITGKFEELVLTRTQLLLDSIRFPSLSAQVIRFLGTNENLSHLFDASAGLKRELSGAPITSIGLDHLHLQEGNVANIKLANTSITCTDLSHANIASAGLIGGTISHSDLSHAVLLDTSLKSAHIQSSDLSDAVIGGERADLTGAVILFSDLQGMTPVLPNTDTTKEERTGTLAALLSRARSLQGSRFDAEVLRRLQDDLGQESYRQLFLDPFPPAGRNSVVRATPGRSREEPVAAASDRENCIKGR